MNPWNIKTFSLRSCFHCPLLLFSPGTTFRNSEVPGQLLRIPQVYPKYHFFQNVCFEPLLFHLPSDSKPTFPVYSHDGWIGFLNSDIIFFLLPRLSHKTVYFAQHCMFRVCSIYTQYNLLNEYEIHMNMLVIERMYIIYIYYLYTLYIYLTQYADVSS